MHDVDRAQILAFRLGQHHLDRRLASRSMVRAVGTTGIQETSARTAGLALHARVAGVTLDKVDRALGQDKTLLSIWAMRGAPYIVPTKDAEIFTAGAVPEGEDSWRTFFGGWAKALKQRSESLSALAQRAAEVARQVLDGKQLPVDEMRHEIARHMPEIRDLTRPTGAHADLPEPLFRATGQLGVVCIADVRKMTDAVAARTDQWLGEPLPNPDRKTTRAELVRRFLRCYGPSTPQAFAEWTSRNVADARAAFEAIGSELVKVDGSQEWLLAADVDALDSPREPTGVRLLPSQDPFLQQRDRERLLPDREQRKRLWRPVGSPGLVLVDGRPAGVWTSRRNGTALDITVEPFRRLSRSDRDAISDEATGIAPLRGAHHATLQMS